MGTSEIPATILKYFWVACVEIRIQNALCQHGIELDLVCHRKDYVLAGLAYQASSYALDLILPSASEWMT